MSFSMAATRLPGGSPPHFGDDASDDDVPGAESGNRPVEAGFRKRHRASLPSDAGCGVAQRSAPRQTSRHLHPRLHRHGAAGCLGALPTSSTAGPLMRRTHERAVINWLSWPAGLLAGGAVIRSSAMRESAVAETGMNGLCGALAAIVVASAR
jgi:hypothetical protein